MSIVSILEALESTTKRLEKEAILKEHLCSNALLQRVLYVVFDPYINFGVSKSKVNNNNNTFVFDDDQSDTMISIFVNNVLNALIERRYTGNAAKAIVNEHMSKCDELTLKWCNRILMRNLRCGIQATTVNKIFPGLINEFNVQLASTLGYTCSNEVITINEKLTYPLVSEPKLDGLRLIVIKHNENVTMFTRNGTQLETLPRLKKFFEGRLDIQEMVFDGEGLTSGCWENSVSTMMAYKNNKGDDGFVYNVFDCMTFQEWEEKLCERNQQERRQVLDSLFSENDEHIIKKTEFNICNNEEDVLNVYKRSLDVGYEGIMIKQPNGLYTFDRSKAWKKLKPIMTYEGVIVGTTDGNVGAKREGKFGGFIVMLENNVTTEVGSGMSDAMKDEINNDRDSYIGKIAEVGGQLLTPDGKIRFPRFVRFRSDNDVSAALVELAVQYRK